MLWHGQSVTPIPGDAEQLRIISPHRRGAPMVFQNYALWPHLRVADNVAFGLVEQKRPRHEIAARVAATLKQVGLSGLENRPPGELSGGQQQRVVLAGALVLNPRVVLLDEPLSNLDAKLRSEMREEIETLHRKTDITFVYVTHDQVEALSLADRMAVMNEGRIEAIGTPGNLYRYPPTICCADFLGESNLVPGTLVTLASLAIALPVAWIIARHSFAGKSLLGAALLIPLILPPFVGAVGMKLVFARCGALSTLLMNIGWAAGPIDWLGACPLLGVVIMEALHLFPVLYLNLVASIANIDPSLEEAAANLGASPWRVFRRVTLPLAWPGLFGGITLVFIWAFTELGTPLVFGVRRVLPVMIYDSVSDIGTNPMGYARVLLVLVLAAGGFWISKRAGRSRGGVATLGRLSVARAETPLGLKGTALAYLLIGGVSGAILCFAFSMLEVADSMILARSEQFYPITKAIYVLIEGLENGVNVAAALGVWAMALLGAALLWTASLLGKRMGQMFRAGH